MKKFALVLLAALPGLGLPDTPAQTPPAPPPGKVTKTADGLTLSTPLGTTTVAVWNPRVLRVTHLPAASGPLPASLTVVAKPAGGDWKFIDDADGATLATGQVQARIDKRTGQVWFLDAAGTPILEETVGSGPLGQRFALDPDEAIYGLGQHPGAGMNYVGQSIRLMQENTKVAVPVLLSSKGYAVLWDNPAVTTVDIGKTEENTLAWQSEAGAGVDYYFLGGSRPDQAIAEYRWLTGPAPMFPRWTWGFWQSRERYKTQEEILGVVAEYRKRNIPLDGIIQDWQYWPPLDQATARGGWGSHEFDPARYPDPAGMVRAVHDQHAHLMISCWPKFDTTDQGVSIPNLQALEAVEGAFAPAVSYGNRAGVHSKWYDPFNDRARGVYWGLMSKELFSLGLDAWWLDASEPELSGKWGEFRGYKTALGPGAGVFNAFPLEHTRAVYEGQRAETSSKRVFLLTRSAFAGQQRNAAVTWSGDITSKWEVFQQQIPAGLNFCASGIPYWNTDIGGFFGNHVKDPDFVERFVRWFQFGAFCPMFRVHGTNDAKEVWRFEEPTQKILIDYIHLRYHLLPYIYSVSWMVTHDAYTMMRPLVMDFPMDEAVRGVDNEFLFGPALLAAPVTQPGAGSRGVSLPKGAAWTDFWTGKACDGGQHIDAASPIETMPLFVRAGSILPYGPAVQYASEKLDAPMELRVYRGADGAFTLYEDEGDNYDYEHGAHATIPLRWDEKTQTLTIGAREGSFPGMVRERTFRVVWVRPDHGVGTASTGEVDAEVKYQGQEVTVSARAF